MPRSKRNRVVTLTKTSKKGREHKQGTMKDIRAAVDAHKHTYLISFHNMRSNHMKDVRLHFRGNSRFFLGKNKIMQLALGRTEQEEYSDNLRKVAKRLVGNVGIMCSNCGADEIREGFASLSVPEFAKAGFEAQATEVLPPGPLEGWQVSMMEQFRKLGVVAEVENSKVVNRSPYALCTKGEPLSPEQAKMLALLGTKLAVFELKLLCHWSEGEFEEFEAAEPTGGKADMDDDEEEEEE